MFPVFPAPSNQEINPKSMRSGMIQKGSSCPQRERMSYEVCEDLKIKIKTVFRYRESNPELRGESAIC